MKDNKPPPDGFDKLLDWLNKDREQAARDYENIRRRLMRMFISRGCYEAEDVTDRTFDRVASKIDQLGDYVGAREPYFYAVGARVLKEWFRAIEKRNSVAPQPVLDPDWKSREQLHGCLDECMKGLPEENRTIVKQYYEQEKRAKIDGRKRLADALGITLNALRIKAFRIRATLQDCVFECLQRKGYEIDRANPTFQV